MKLVMMPAMIIFAHIVAVGMIFLMMVAVQVWQRCGLRILVRLPGCSEQDLPVAVGHLLKDLQRLRLGGRRRGRRRGGLSGGGPRDHPTSEGDYTLDYAHYIEANEYGKSQDKLCSVRDIKDGKAMDQPS